MMAIKTRPPNVKATMMIAGPDQKELKKQEKAALRKNKDSSGKGPGEQSTEGTQL